VVFNYAFDNGLIDRPVRYGQSFKRPSKKTLRKARAATGPRLFEADELHKMLDDAGTPLECRACFETSGVRRASRDGKATLDAGTTGQAAPRGGLSQQALAVQAGLSVSVVARIEQDAKTKTRACPRSRR
jgi:hypothetical protein